MVVPVDTRPLIARAEGGGFRLGAPGQLVLITSTALSEPAAGRHCGCQFSR
jgi:hypothetical protein